MCERADRRVAGGEVKLMLQRVDDFEKSETMEVGIPCANLPDAVLTHENGGMRVVKQIAGEMGNLLDNLLGDRGMSLGRDEKTEPRRGKKRGDEFQPFDRTPWPTHHPRVSGYAQELIEDRPGRVPGICSASLTFKPIKASGMKR